MDSTSPKIELWDVYDINRIKTGKTHRRGEPLLAGEYHLVVHVCIFDKEDRLLIQQRQSCKEGWPGMWDLSVGGSAVTGDDSIKAAERETLEEIGYAIDLSLERPYFTMNFVNGFDDYYLVEKELDINELKLQEEEVQAVKWATKNEILQMIHEGVFIPYYLIDTIFDLRHHRGSIRY